MALHHIVRDTDGKARCSCNCGADCDNAGKHPRWDKELLSNGVNSATAHPDLIHRWWERWPDANVAVATGTKSGFWALDVDGEEGEQTLRDLEQAHGPLPDTIESKTGGGGRHLLFVMAGVPVRNKVRFAPGLDTRSDGGMIVVDPSTHVSGNEYAWEASSHPEDVDIRAAPAWLIDLVTQDPSKRDGKQAEPVADRIPEGKRNAALTSLAGSMRHRGMTEDEILIALRGVNRNRCEPPLDEDELATIAKSVAGYEPAETDGGHDRRSAPDRLTDYALDDSDSLFVDQHGEPHALLDGQPLALTGRCYRWLRNLMWQNEQRSATREGLSQAAGTLGAMALATGDVRELHVRSAWHDEGLFVELAKGRVVRIDAQGWRMVENPPVLFRRFVNLKPLPDPVRGGDIDTLVDRMPLKSERYRRLVTAYIVTGLLPQISRPMLLTTGGQGGGKTTLNRIIKCTVDPTTPETIRLDPRETLQKASHCAVVLLDNCSYLRDSAIDTLCRLVTGEGDSKRKLYSDDDDIIYEMRRLILLNAINSPADRPDFLDRCLCVDLERISPDERIPERKLWAAFNAGHPQWLGAMFDLLGRAISLHDTLDLPSLPRLADWGEWAASVYEATDWGAETFMSDWKENVAAQHEAVLEGSLLLQVVLWFMDGRDRWQGAPNELLGKLQLEADDRNLDIARDKTFPKTPDWLWRRMKELLPALSAHGVEASRATRSKTRDIVLRNTSTNGVVGDDGVETGQSGTVAAPFASTPSTTPFPPMNVSDDVGVDGKTPLKGHTSAAVLMNVTNDTNDTILADMSEEGLAADDNPDSAAEQNELWDELDAEVAPDGDG